MAEEYSESRRKFLGYAIGGIAGAVVIGYAVPLTNFVVRPALGKSEETWAEVGAVGELPLDEPTAMTFFSRVKVGWQDEKVEHDIWAVRRQDGTVTVYSPTCPHLGCGFRWNPDTRRFECPCHSSVFDVDGRLLGGPAPRGLDTLQSKVEGGRLYVVFKKFRLGIPQKVEA